MKIKLKGHNEWKDMFRKKDLVKLLKSINVWMINQKGERDTVLYTYLVIAWIFRMRKHSYGELSELKRRFEATIDVFEHLGVKFGGCLVDILEGCTKRPI